MSLFRYSSFTALNADCPSANLFDSCDVVKDVVLSYSDLPNLTRPSNKTSRIALHGTAPACWSQLKLDQSNFSLTMRFSYTV